MSTYRTTLTREAEDGEDIEIPVVVSYTFHRAHRGATDGKYGPPLEPSEPAHIEIDDVSTPSGEWICTEDDELAKLEAEIMSDLADRSGDYDERE